MSKLSSEDIQKNLDPDGSLGVTVYDGKGEGDKQIWVKPNGSPEAIKGGDQQTYLIQFPVPMGEQDIKKEVQKSFMDGLKEKVAQLPSGYITQPPLNMPLEIETDVNETGTGGRDFKVTEIIGLKYDVRLTFESAPPESGSGAPQKSWVLFDGANAPELDPTEKDKNIYVWRSGAINKTVSGKTKIVNITLALPAGTKYKPELEFKDFTGITVEFTNEYKKPVGSTEPLSSLITMLGGIEFEQAWMYIFSGIAVSDISFKGKPKGGAEVNLFNNLSSLTTSGAFDKNKFYGGGEQQVTASATQNIASDILAKSAKPYELECVIAAGTSVTLKSDAGVVMALLVPLRFKVSESASDPKVEKVHDESNKEYLKLDVEQLKGVVPDNFKLSQKVKEANLGTLKKASAKLIVYNKILPDALKVGIQPQDDPTLYRPISLRDGESSNVDYDVKKDILHTPALLAGPIESGKTDVTFKIPCITQEMEASSISVRIIADAKLDFDYKQEL